VKLQLAASRILKLDAEALGGPKPSTNKRVRGRPTDVALNILSRELMDAWKELTGHPPKLTVNHDGEVTCPFCLFFHRYFGGEDRRFKARAIADRCSKLVPATD
jgi:hypothetical protein